jgi:tetratricopeptide (TPR) repeat protein
VSEDRQQADLLKPEGGGCREPGGAALGPAGPVPSGIRPGRRRRLGWCLLAAAVLLLLGVGGYFLGRQLWARQHLEQAREALRQRNFAEALSHLRRCLEVWPRDPATHLLAAQAARRAGLVEEARRRLLDCARLPAAPEALRLEHNLLQATAGDLAPVESDLLERVRRDSPDAVLILEALTAGYVRMQHFPQALHCAEELLRREPDHVQGLLWHGWAMERLNRFKEALEDYRRAVELRPDDVLARLSLGEVLLYLKRPGDAVEHFTYLQDRQPGDVSSNSAVRLGLARCRRGLGETEEARHLLDELVRESPQEALILSERGQLALEEGQEAAAEDWLRRALALAPHDRLTNFALYQCLQRRGNADEARRYLEEVRRLDADLKRLTELRQALSKPSWAPAQRREAGLLCLRLGREPEGLAWLFSSLQEDPRQPEVHQALADYFERTGQAERAARHRRLARAD